MKLHIQDVVKIVKAEIDIADGITLIAGDNEQGKTSVLMSLASLVTGEAVPFPEVTKKDARFLVNSTGNAKSAMATLATKGGTAVVKWPSCKVDAPEKLSSVYAAGLKEPTKIPSHELTKLLGILPTKEQFVAEMDTIALQCEDIGAVVEGVWSKIQSTSWDAAHEQAVARRQSLKQEWARSAGIPWAGDTAAGTWKPEHFVPGKTLEELEGALKSEEKIFEFALKSEALNERERENLQELAAKVPDLQSKIEESFHRGAEIQDRIVEAQELLKQLPKILNSQKIYHCWSCKAANALKGERLVEPSIQVPEEEIAAANARYEQQEAAIRELQELRRDEEVNQRTLQAQLAESNNAQKKLTETNLDAVSEASVDDARVNVELCRKQIAAFKAAKECKEIFDSHATCHFLCAVLSPDGLRKIVLGASLEKFNDLLAVICENAEWPLITVDEFLKFYFGGYPYAFLSKGAKYAVNAALQIAFAKLDGSKVLIFDGVDIMGTELRSGLFKILECIPLRSVVGCRYDNISEVPEAFAESAYWCQGGVVTPVAQPAGVR